jgi:hypothetical protein
VEDLTREPQRAAAYVGRLWDNPLVSLRCLKRPVEEFWATAPSWLQDRARLPMTPVQLALWEVIRDPARLGTAAVARVPAWVAEYEAGYVLHFLLPEYGVNVQIDPWKPEYEQEEPPDIDFDEDPDHPLNDSRDEDLLETFGIETVTFWDTAVLEMGAEETCEEIRRELGFGRPPWMQRIDGARPSKVAPP